MLIGLLLAFALSSIQQSGKHVVSPITTYHGLDLCNFAKVYKLAPGSYLSVRSGPGEQYSKIDHLPDGKAVYICDEHREWVQIFYSGLDGPCGSASPAGLDAHKAATCKSGWVNRQWIDVLSG